MLPCYECGGYVTYEETVDTINHWACEIVIKCANCHNEVNYWAYGIYQEPRTKTELMWHAWYHSKLGNTYNKLLREQRRKHR